MTNGTPRSWSTVRGSLARLAMALTAATAVTAMLLAAPASANEETGTLLELSGDGVHYSTGLVAGILGDTSGFVPGESRHGTIWVRNASGGATVLSVGVGNTDRIDSAVLPAYLQLQAHSGHRSTNLGALPGPGACSPFVEDWALAPGETLRLDLGLTLVLQAPNATRNQKSNFDLVFLLQGDDGGQTVNACGAGTGSLPADVSASFAPITGGTAGAPAVGNVIAGSAGDSVSPDDPGNLEQGPRDQAGPEREWSVAPLLQSNVEANDRSPWPWLLILSAGTYMVISLRRRTR
ncbi:hypothetical protein [Arthrobacter sp. GMC3]|uniref:hypothetical protein n=1 Tax=Arthrobacter sp. GMC3 TaxID=2058894 RepID=UPI000CE333E0|nr:hypothetical protein [Arthrobacter sp. GMC3]